MWKPPLAPLRDARSRSRGGSRRACARRPGPSRPGAAAMKTWRMQRHRRARDLADLRRVDAAPRASRAARWPSPRDHALERSPTCQACSAGVGRQEDHARRRRRPAGGRPKPSRSVSLRKNASGSWISTPAPSPGLGIAAARAAVVQVLEHLDPLAHDVVRRLARDVRDEADAARVVLVGGVVEALRGAAGPLAASSRSPSPPRAHAPARRGVALARPARRPRAARATRSMCVESTTIVSVRVTPSIERIRSISRSSALRVLASSP